ncbi:MAG: hypothetical protein NWT12_00060, partial [Paracoccaceae bacterium]|nr:hypothetical protein [Paracoccaceae bacterium]
PGPRFLLAANIPAGGIHPPQPVQGAQNDAADQLSAASRLSLSPAQHMLGTNRQQDMITP